MATPPVTEADDSITSTACVGKDLPSVSQTPLNTDPPIHIAETSDHTSMPESATCVPRKEEHCVIDLTENEVEATETIGCDDQFDDFMDDLDDEEFCSSFVNFDADNDKDYRPSEGEGEWEEEEGDSSDSGDGEEWESEGVDYVKTVAEIAEEANTDDLFDPKVLGELQ